MKRILACALLPLACFTLQTHADTLVPLGSNLSVSSAIGDSGWVVVGGSLQTQAANVLPGNAPLYVASGGVLDMRDFQQSIGSVGGEGTIHLGSAVLPSESGLVRLGNGRLGLGANSGFAGASDSREVSIGGTTISGGGIATISAGGGSVQDTAVIAVGGNTSSAGTLILGVTNRYVNHTAGTVNIQSGSYTIAGSGTVGLVTIGGGMLTLSGANVYQSGIVQTGGTVVLTGSVTGGGTVQFSGSQGQIVNNTTQEISVAGSTFSFDLGQQILWSASDTMILFTGTDGQTLGSVGLIGSTSGFTLVYSSSAARMAMLRTSSLVPVSSSNGTLITGADNNSQVFSGSITGNGGVVKTGTGVWVLSGTNTYAGLTTVADGALVINGSVASDVFVWGGVLGGSGSIGGSVLNQGVVSPGNSPGTLTIAGDYDQASNGALVIQIASPYVYDRLVIGGAAHLDGLLAVDLIDGFTLQRGQSFLILTADGGVNGMFSQAFINTNTLLSLGIVYYLDGVVLQTIQGSFANDVPGLTPNELSVAKALDKVVNSKRVAKLVDTLDALPISAIPAALEQIVPANLLAMFDASIASATVQADNLERRLEEVRAGSTGISTGGLHLTDSRGTVGGSGDGQQAIGKDGKALEETSLSNRWGYFVNGSGEFIDTESTAIAQGTEFTTGGISAGADYRFCDNAVAGLAAGYANTATDSRNENSVKINSGKLGFYGTVYKGGLFLNGGAGAGFNSYDTKRDTIGSNALGDTEGIDFNSMIGTGYTARIGGWSFGPIASLRYSWVGIDGFTERGSYAPLRYDDQSEESLRSTAGAQVAYAFQLCQVLVKPAVRAQWQHEYLEASRSIGASFLPGGSFTAVGPETGRDSLLLDAGVTVQLNPRMGIYAYYTGDLGRDDYSSQSVNGGVQVSF